MTLVKLCGLTREEDIITANELRPDYIGFVFFEKSKRNISKKDAATLKRKLDKNIKAVGVFVDAELSFITELYDEGIIDYAQLHGHEDDDYIMALKAKGISVIKAFKISGEEDVRVAENSKADNIMFDAGAGCGKTFDWELLARAKRPYFLAGGLDTENVADAIKKLNPYAVDVSSGIETDGTKDPDKMELFVSRVRIGNAL
ncbi:phosphoribosylanthranilate isomerase [Butyrivibrio sp. WCD3002]|uniref:phosphoribosylanthranilate isomerase n=1 Tax=Butyrivibrio sp. WCD3002 TaxID=1280676 RepID=UPI000407E4C0|nr:phosphoribosylanthranilate isomerase [Butyrivibrio sp. WCD3002]